MPETFGKYEILRKLGAGGMAEVFLVRSQGAAGVEKRLVVKRILPDFARSARFNAMFIDEARIAVSLNHPNIVQVYDFGLEEGHYYLAMEFVDGTDLARWLADAFTLGRRPSPGVAAFVLCELLKGLDYAHNKQDGDGQPLRIVHRDVSPQNVLIGYEGGVKVADFGIARARTAAPEDRGVVKGKLAYMAPEQARVGPLDHRADLYAAGVLLWELLAARGLFTGSEPAASPVVDEASAARIPSPHDVDPTVPEALSAICRKALAYDPDQRYPDARAMSADLARWLLSTGEVHDAFTLSEHVVGVRAAMAARRAAGDDAPAPTIRLTGATADSGGGLAPVKTAPALPAAVAPAGPVTLPTPPERPGHGPDRPRRSVTVRKDVLCICGAVEGFADLRRAAGEERFRQSLIDYLAMLESIAFKASAVTRRASEGGFTMVVGLPLSRETDGAKAVALALDVSEATDGVNRNLECPLTVSLGIYRGGCSVTRTPGERPFEHELDPGVEEAARRLAREAQPGEVLVSAGAWRAARRDFRFEPVAALLVPDLADDITGTAGRMRAYSLAGRRDRSERARDARAARGRIHGRELEMRTLADAFGRVALDGEGRVTAVVGEAGIGKTALVEEFLATHVAEARVLKAEAARLDAPPYSLVADLLADLLDLADTDGPREHKRKLETWFRAHSETLRPHEARYLLHSLGGLLRLKYRDSVVDGLDPEARRARTFLSLRRALELMAIEMPLVAAFDGLERADRTSLSFLRDLVREGAPPGVHVLLVGRPGAGADGLFRELSEAPPAGAASVRLDDLSERAREALVRDWLGERDDARVIAEAVTGRGGGNPLFLLELLETLEEQSLLDVAGRGGTLPMPRSVEALLAARLDALDEDDRALVVRIAQLDRPVTADLAAALCPDLDGPRQALGRLADLGMLVREPGEAAWRFRRPLLRECAAAALPPAEVPGVHGRAARWLEERAEEGLAVDPGEVARHHLRAGEHAEAGAHYVGLGHQAFEAGSTEAAVEFLGRAVDLLPDDAPERLFATDLLEQAWARSGRADGREAVVALLMDAAERSGRPDAVCSAHLRRARWHVDRMAPGDARADIDRALALARSEGVRAEEGRALAALAGLALTVGDHAEAEALSRQALAVFEVEGLAADAASTWNVLGAVRRQVGDPAGAVESFRRGLDAQRPGADETTREATLTHLAMALDAHGDHEEAISVASQALKLNREIGNRGRTGLVLGHLGQIYLEAGDVERAYACARQSVRHCRERANPLHEGLALVSLARVELERGRFDEARTALLYASAVAADTRAGTPGAPSPQLDIELALAQARLSLDGTPAAPDSAQEQAAAAAATAQAHGQQAMLAVALARRAEALAAATPPRAADAADASARAMASLPAVAPVVEVEVCATHHAVTGDPAARVRARESVVTRAGRIQDNRLRASFLARPLHRRVME